MRQHNTQLVRKLRLRTSYYSTPASGSLPLPLDGSNDTPSVEAHARAMVELFVIGPEQGNPFSKDLQ